MYVCIHMFIIRFLRNSFVLFDKLPFELIRASKTAPFRTMHTIGNVNYTCTPLEQIRKHTHMCIYIYIYIDVRSPAADP